MFGADPGGFFTRNLVIVAGGAVRSDAREIARRGSPGRTAAPALRAAHSSSRDAATESRGSTTPGPLRGLRRGAGARPGPAAQRPRRGEETDVVVAARVRACGAWRRRRPSNTRFPGTQRSPTLSRRYGWGNGTLIANAILVILVIALIVGAISVANTMAMSIMERQGELGAAEHRRLVPGARRLADLRRRDRGQHARRRRRPARSA